MRDSAALNLELSARFPDARPVLASLLGRRSRSSFRVRRWRSRRPQTRPGHLGAVYGSTILVRGDNLGLPRLSPARIRISSRPHSASSAQSWGIQVECPPAQVLTPIVWTSHSTARRSASTAVPRSGRFSPSTPSLTRAGAEAKALGPA